MRVRLESGDLQRRAVVVDDGSSENATAVAGLMADAMAGYGFAAESIADAFAEVAEMIRPCPRVDEPFDDPGDDVEDEILEDGDGEGDAG